MRPKSMILILIALFCGLIASIGISQVVARQNKEEEPKVKTVKIFVASTDIDISEDITAQNVKLADWPADKVPEGALKDLDSLIGRRPRMRLFKDDTITQKKLLAPNEIAGGSNQIPKGYRVMSVKVSMATSVSYLIKPGDRVDVLVFHKRGGGRSRTSTLMRNVTVFAVNSKVTREVDDQGQAIHAKTISMLVKPEEVEKLAHAEETGRIRLSLRRPDEEVSESESKGYAYEDEDELKIPAGPGTGGLLESLGAMAMAAPSAPVFEMQVMSGGNLQNYTWNDVNSLPLELQKQLPKQLAGVKVTPALGGTSLPGMPTPEEQVEMEEAENQIAPNLTPEQEEALEERKDNFESLAPEKSMDEDSDL